MQVAGVAKQFNETNLKLIKQLGVDDFVYYSMQGMPDTLEELSAVKELVQKNGLRLSVIEGGPVIDQIVLAKDRRNQQIEEYIQSIRNMGRLGIRVLCYNFMPQVTSAAMVVRTSTVFEERGGAYTSQYREADLRDEDIVHDEQPTTDEEMWDNLEYFLKRIVPVAEQEEVLLAMHPDDPPLSPLCNLSRIMRNVANFDRLLSIVDSPVNGLTLCQGCFAEMGCDLVETIRHFKDRIHFAHFRDIFGTPTDFHETFPDNGANDMLKVIKTYREIGYGGFIRVDHVPLLATESGDYDGYGMIGHSFAIGYLKGLMESVYGKSASQSR
ncbi:mannonate dehydratase [Bythopirellula goksoeyrii]|uniref:mannonate dehydratase n=1 Tax=Bythopirellula goksoeyrii TaxID=1400387 RepID=A0A5B9QFG9_9BACT|nr:mannonate dehydratase [Bythopirellula goksoeyrii]QEG36410.1 Mannonate dehydratase [Bythopirellula goksoeyrii]